VAIRYYLRLPEPAKARGTDPRLSFASASADGLAEELQAALRTPALFERWCATLDDPEGVDPGLGRVDPQARVQGEQDDLGVVLIATTTLPGSLLSQRMRWLAGPHWQLRDVGAA
jgi:hypothetical protein